MLARVNLTRERGTRSNFNSWITRGTTKRAATPRMNSSEAWRPLLFADEDQESKASRDPVAPAERSDAALRKVHTKQLEDNSVVHSFRTLLDDLARIVSNTCRCPGSGAETPMFTKTTMPNVKQQRALNLLQTIRL